MGGQMKLSHDIEEYSSRWLMELVQNDVQHFLQIIRLDHAKCKRSLQSHDLHQGQTENGLLIGMTPRAYPVSNG